MPEIAVDNPLGTWISPVKKELATLSSSIEACKETVCRQVIRCSEGTDKIIKDVQEVKSDLMSCKAESRKIECIEERVSKLEGKADIITRDLEKHKISQGEVIAEMKEHMSLLESKLAEQKAEMKEQMEQHMSTLEQENGKLLHTIDLLKRQNRDLQARLDDMEFRSHSESTSSISSGYQSSRLSDVSINSEIEPAARNAATKARILKKQADKAHLSEEDNEPK